MKVWNTLILLLLTVAVTAQSPWTQKKDKSYLQLSFTSISNYDQIYAKTAYPTDRKITDNTLQFYGEYGLSDKTTLFTAIPLKLVSSGDAVRQPTATTKNSKTSLGNIQLGIKHNFYQKQWIISGQFTVEANTGSFEVASGLRTGYDAWSFTPLFLIGRGFNNWYIQAFTGFDIRTNGYSSNYKLGGELGYKAAKWLWIAGFLDGVASFKNGDVVLPASNTLTGLYVNDQSFAAFGLKLIGEIHSDFGVNLGFGGALSGRNVPKKPALSFGLFHKF